MVVTPICGGATDCKTRPYDEYHDAKLFFSLILITRYSNRGSSAA